MIWLILILIYITTLIVYILSIYLMDKKCIHTVGNLIDKIEFYMLIPFMNTFVLISLGVGIIVIIIIKLLKLDIMWKNFKNIKLK